jgi:acyl-coenzyme A thioesterase PaaI-like protein
MSTKLIRRFINWWPPFLFSGIRVTRIAEDWRHIEVELRLRWWNRNAVGTMFGGSLFAMIDPFYPLMLQHNLGPDYIVWVKSAAIEFVAPGRSVALASFRMSTETINEIRAATESGERHLPAFSVTVSDPQGNPVARVDKRLYVRRKRAAVSRALPPPAPNAPAPRA